jgi:putative spermidine/putrescine transport system substrate-binding protein
VQTALQLERDDNMKHTGAVRPSGLRRRDILKVAAVTAPSLLLGQSPRAYAQDKLSGRGEVVVFSYGGAFTQDTRKNVYEPFTKATGITVVDVTADIAEPQVKAMNKAGRVDWDLAFIDPRNRLPMHEAGMFVPIDYSLWDDESLKGIPQSARLSDSVVAFQSSVVLVYDERTFPSSGPKNWADFWNVKAFPGPRGMRNMSSTGAVNLIFALVADGMTGAQVWPLTDDKLDRAFKKLDEIKPHIAKWWSAGGEPIQALLNKEFAMSTCYDSRALAARRQGLPLRMVWEGGISAQSYYSILKGGPNTANAQKFLAFVNRSANAAAFTLANNLPSPNANQLEHIPADMRALLSINPENKSKLIPYDETWAGAKRSDGKTNSEHTDERSLAWGARG